MKKTFSRKKFYLRFFILIIIAVVLNILLISFLFDLFGNKEIDKDKIELIKSEVLSKDISKEEIFNYAFNYEYEYGKKRMSIFSTVITGNFLPLITEKVVK